MVVLCLILDNFQVIPLSFSTNLDLLNPNIPEWREDVGQVVTKILTKVGPQQDKPRLTSPVQIKVKWHLTARQDASVGRFD